MTIDPFAMALLLVLIALAAFINGTIGFGFALLAVIALALVLDAKTGVVVTSLITPCMSGTQALHFRDRRHLVTRLRGVLAGGLLGTAVGTQLLIVLPSTLVTAALGVFTIAYVVDSLRASRPPLAGSTQRWLGPAAGFVGGVSNGTLGASGPVFGTYLTAIGLRARDFAFGISIVFFIMAVLRVGLLAGLGQYTPTILLLGVALAVPSVLVQRVGFWLKGRLPAETLYRGLLVLLLVAGANLLLRAATSV